MIILRHVLQVQLATIYSHLITLSLGTIPLLHGESLMKARGPLYVTHSAIRVGCRAGISMASSSHIVSSTGGHGVFLTS